MIYGPIGLAFLIRIRKTRAAQAFAFVSAVIALIFLLDDYTIGEVVRRTSPMGDQRVLTYPSGHVYGAVVFFGFIGLLAIYYRVRKKLLGVCPRNNVLNDIRH